MMKKGIYDRLHQILTSEDPPEGYEHLGTEERKRIIKILRETKSDLPPNWHDES